VYICVCVCVNPEKEREIYYKELVHVIMKDDKSQDLQLSSWRAKRANGVVPVQI